MPYQQSIYEEIAQRCEGDMYIGVVGPVRTGKSTLIKRFMETTVLPNIKKEYDRERARDSMPQSASGKTVMTTEPKFIPDEAVEIGFDGVSTMRVRMVDCVGYLVKDALGTTEGEGPRMVMTPWREEAMPFEEAAEYGTKKVMTDHSTVGIVVTSDGSICDIDRAGYEEAERRVIAELSALGKPFVIVLNSARPEAPESEALALSLEETYRVPVALVNCLTLDSEDIRHIMEMLLYEFPIAELTVSLPSWCEVLDREYPVMKAIEGEIFSLAGGVRKVGELKAYCKDFQPLTYTESLTLRSLSLGTGKASLSAQLREGLYYRVISELCSLEIADEGALLETLCRLAAIEKRYQRIAQALDAVEETGYGIVSPEIGDMKLEDPKIVRHSGGYGVRLKASAPSIHMIRATIETEIDPVVGSEQQSEELLTFLLSEFSEDPNKIWETNLFGKTLYQLVNEGLSAKLSNIGDSAREKLSETLSRIVNEGSGGLVCIIL
ncbi:MAG: stage IV sporulation protein A [Clostridia bacterium]|nr:stage IV sporulation protein A [Clostridia bacterium]